MRGLLSDIEYYEGNHIVRKFLQENPTCFCLKFVKGRQAAPEEIPWLACVSLALKYSVGYSLFLVQSNKDTRIL